MAQLQHNMRVVASRAAVLSVITGGGKWVEITTHADPLYQHLIVTAERKSWRCVESGELPRLFGVEPPRPRIEAVRIVDMSGSNAWAEFAGIFAGLGGPSRTRTGQGRTGRALCRRMPRRRSVTASAPSARNPAPSASTSSSRRAAMQRTSHSIACLAAALAKAQAELTEIRRNLWWRRSGRIALPRPNGRSAMPRFRAGWTSSARTSRPA